MRRVLAIFGAAALLALGAGIAPAVAAPAAPCAWVTLTSNHNDLALVDNYRGGTATTLRAYVGIQYTPSCATVSYRKYSQLTVLDGLHAKLQPYINDGPCGETYNAYSTAGSSLIVYSPATSASGPGGCNELSVTNGTPPQHLEYGGSLAWSFGNDLSPNSPAYNYLIYQNFCQIGDPGCPWQEYQSPLAITLN